MGDSKPEQFIEAKIDVDRSIADAVCNFIIDNFTRGMILEEEEHSAMTGITFYLPESFHGDYKTQLSSYLKEIIGDGCEPPAVRERLIKNIEWVQQYRESIRPFVLANDVVVRPPW